MDRKRKAKPSSIFDRVPKRPKEIQSSPVFIDLTDPPPITAVASSPVSFSNVPLSQASETKPVKPKAPRKKAKPKEPDLCPEQERLVDLILNGSNVFYTGSAGCGKSTVLRAFVQKLRDIGREVRIVAPTGRAAVDIGGQTLHAFAGITPDSLKMPLEQLKRRAYGKTLLKRFKSTDVLVIDEISMVENHLLERLSEMLKEARGSHDAFGGMQVILLGDFYQLPPVKPFQYCITCGRENKVVVPSKLYKCPQHGEYRDDNKWAFRSKAWRDAQFVCVNLTSIHRQKDAKFIAMLENCRQGKSFTTAERQLLLKHKCNVDQAVQLYATREEVRRVNEAQFAKLQSKTHSFKCLDGIDLKDHHRQALQWKAQRDPDGSLTALKEHRFEKFLELKEGMQVILLVNLDMEQGLINGSQGIIVGWDDMVETNLPIVAENDKNGTSGRPLIYGDHAYTREASIKQFVKVAICKKWPIVHFDNGIKRPIMAECTVSELGDDAPHSIICRAQIPLLPAWAMSIHKSQGMTLSKVIVDLSRSFEEGQAYVALSRAKSLSGLKVIALGQDQSGPNYEVMSFLNEAFGKTGPPLPSAFMGVAP